MYEQKIAPVFSFFSKVAMLGRGFVELGLILKKLNQFLKASMDFNSNMIIRGLFSFFSGKQKKTTTTKNFRSLNENWSLPNQQKIFI